ncbi:phenylalanine--tRNA ligase subunit alpha [Nannocystis punicea]|uniref:Phenylalanine--tRNA ligase alpha subunit n=1 Tax=Nannocystis punicea TaxID=2995304 RepID=A0ABY7HI52_9BACT|nr:phenylalanine--tRNA ligase subunit alpha [Nannocystis poenicansa]WAS98991.1 phenylalanine--tRNA ligase subunit alpha [Nannocystis poenicansa]
MPARLATQLAAFQEALARVDSEAALYELQVAYLGKKGTVTQLRGEMGKLPPEQRKGFGAEWNRVRDAIEAALEERRTYLKDQARRLDLARVEDLTLPPLRPPAGTLHPLSQTRRRLSESFQRLGFSLAVGPHVEHSKYNFDDLNVPKNHPARDMADTFFIRPHRHPGFDDHSDNDAAMRLRAGELVLRTHTSPVQVRTMLTQKPPIRIVALGTTFRCDDDATHSPMFHQIEGLYVDRGVTMADLKATLMDFTRDFYGRRLDVRFRPSFFPFVEPGAEFDIGCPFCGGDGCNLCKRTGYIEIGGCGMVHPAVFEACGIDPEVYTGWAFGFGVDRMTMSQHAVPHLRHMFEGDVRFLEQFP